MSRKSQQSMPLISEEKVSEGFTDLCGQSLSIASYQEDFSQGNELTDDQIPAKFKDPISYELMEDPVMTEHHQTYDRKTIEEWLRENNTDPLPGQELKSKTLKPNSFLKNLIDEFKRDQQDPNMVEPTAPELDISNEMNHSMCDINSQSFFNHDERKKIFVRNIYFFIEDLKSYINTHMSESSLPKEYEFFCAEKTVEALSNADDISFNMANVLMRANIPEQLIQYIESYLNNHTDLNFAKEYYGFSCQLVDLINGKNMKTIKLLAGMKEDKKSFFSRITGFTPRVTPSITK